MLPYVSMEGGDQIIRKFIATTKHRHRLLRNTVKPPFHGACFGVVSAPTLSARVPRRARAAFEKERFHYEHSSCFHGADCRAD